MGSSNALGSASKKLMEIGISHLAAVTVTANRSTAIVVAREGLSSRLFALPRRGWVDRDPLGALGRVGYLHGAQDAGGGFALFLWKQPGTEPVEVAEVPDLSAWEREQGELKRRLGRALLRVCRLPEVVSFPPPALSSCPKRGFSVVWMSLDLG